MSFDVFLITFRNGVNAEADASAARSVLERYRFKKSPEFDAYDLDFDDGSHLEMYTGGLDDSGKKFDGAMFALRGFGAMIGTFIFEFSRAAGSAIFPAMEPACVLLPRDDLAVHLPASVTEKFKQIPVANGEELLAALSGGYDAWRVYRDHIISKSDDAPARET